MEISPNNMNAYLGLISICIMNGLENLYNSNIHQKFHMQEFKDLKFFENFFFHKAKDYTTFTSQMKNSVFFFFLNKKKII